MSEGPTTAGAIVGKLSMDKDQWKRDVAEAKADAAELGALEPTIKVEAKVGDALAKLEAVRAAQEKLGFASDNLKLAYQRLDEVQTKGGASQSRLMQLHLAAARAESAHAAATKGLAAAEASLADENDNVDASNKRVVASSNSNISRMALIAGAIAALIPLLSSLAGYTVGVAGALAGMGAAGILAIIGIKHAMDSGSVAGNQFSDGLQSLKGNLDQLAGTAASNMLLAFRSAVESINSAMPQLNSQIGLFSKQLGTTGDIVLNGVLTAFRVLNPLFLQAGVYVEQLAVGFQKWTSNGGLHQFTHDAIVALPQVAQALGALVLGALNLIQALAPLGTVLLGTLTLIGNLVSFLTTSMGPAFAPVVAGVLAAVGAFKLMGIIEPILLRITAAIGGIAAAEQLALGPIGWVVAAVTALGTAFLVASAATDSAATAQNDYTAAIQQDNGVVGEATKKQVAKALGDSKALDTARQLSISTKLLTNATLGHTDAQAELQKKIDGVNKKIDEQIAAQGTAVGGAALASDSTKKLRADVQLLSAEYEKNKTGIKDTIKAYNDIADAQGLTNISTRAQLQAQTDLAAAYGMSLPQYLATIGAQKQNADQAGATTRQLQLENDAATLLGNAFTLLNGGTLGVAQAQTGAASAANSLVAALKANGLEIDGNTQKAVANQQAIQQKVLADQQSAEAIAKQTGSTKAGTDAFAASKVALEQQLAAQGLLNPAVQAYIDKLYAIPAVKPTKIDMDAAEALRRVQELKGWMDSLTSKTIVMTVQTNQVGAPAGVGITNTVRKYADGGTVAGSGGPKADTVQAYLSVGEEVTPNPQSGRYRTALKALASDNVPAARAALGGGGAPVSNYYFTINDATNPVAVGQMIKHYLAGAIS
jgi:hypothetical protein